MYICKEGHEPIMFDIYGEPTDGKIQECPMCRLLQILKNVKENNMKVIELFGYRRT